MCTGNGEGRGIAKWQCHGLVVVGAGAKPWSDERLGCNRAERNVQGTQVVRHVRIAGVIQRPTAWCRTKAGNNLLCFRIGGCGCGFACHFDSEAACLCEPQLTRERAGGICEADDMLRWGGCGLVQGFTQ